MAYVVFTVFSLKYVLLCAYELVGNVYGLIKTEEWSTIWLITGVSINSFPLFGLTYQLIPMYGLIGSEE